MSEPNVNRVVALRIVDLVRNSPNVTGSLLACDVNDVIYAELTASLNAEIERLRLR